MYQRLVCDSFHYVPPWDAQSLEDRLAALDEDLPRVAWLYERPDTSTFRYRVFNMVECLQQETPRRVAASWFSGSEIDALIPRLPELDVLVLARASQPMPDEVLLMGASNLSPATIDVNVIGEVKAPGRIALRANTPLVEAILSAGGPNNWRANRGNVELVRLNRNGTATRQIFTLNYTKGVSNAFNPPLRANDTVIVHRSLYGEAVDVLNQAIVPLTQIANFWAYYNNWFSNP